MRFLLFAELTGLPRPPSSRSLIQTPIDSMSNEENEIQTLESQFPLLSGQAFAEARQKVLNAGHSVLQVEDGGLYRVDPLGNKTLVKEIEPPQLFIVGTKLKIR